VWCVHRSEQPNSAAATAGEMFFFFEKKSRTLFMTYEGRGAENFKKIFQESNESK